MAAEDVHGHILFSIDVSIASYMCVLELLTKLSRAGLINMRVRIHVAYGLIAATYLATLFSILFGCHPMHKNWQIYPNPGSKSFRFADMRPVLIDYRLLPARRVKD